MSAAEVIAAKLSDGCAYRSGGWWRATCPAHGSRADTLALTDAQDGLRVYCHAGCQPEDILAALRRLELLVHESGGSGVPPDPAELERRRAVEARHRQQRITCARDILAAARPVACSPVERYLHTRIPGIAAVPEVIGYIPMGDYYAQHRRSGSRRPVMVAAVEHVQDGIVGAHRTWLMMDGSGKASLDPVRMSNGPIKGAAVRLAPAAEQLLLGEGIETVLAAMVATGMPGWAALSAGGVKALVLPPIVGTVVILADNDPSGCGERAARYAAQRWLAEGRRVQIAMPPDSGTDFNDVLLGRTHSQTVEALDVAA